MFLTAAGGSGEATVCVKLFHMAHMLKTKVSGYRSRGSGVWLPGRKVLVLEKPAVTRILPGGLPEQALLTPTCSLIEPNDTLSAKSLWIKASGKIGAFAGYFQRTAAGRENFSNTPMMSSTWGTERPFHRVEARPSSRVTSLCRRTQR